MLSEKKIKVNLVPEFYVLKRYMFRTILFETYTFLKRVHTKDKLPLKKKLVSKNYKPEHYAAFLFVFY